VNNQTTFRVEKLDYLEYPYRAKLLPDGQWYYGESVDEAVRKVVAHVPEAPGVETLGPWIGDTNG